jgi:flagellar biosynthetic protein FlhB
MAETDNSQEKTEQPTPKKLREARQQGQVPRSRELNSTAIMMIGSAGLLMLGSFMIGELMQMMRSGFSLSRAELLDSNSLLEHFSGAVVDALLLLTPFLLLMTLVALFTPLMLGGWSFSPEALSFKTDRLNPLSGLKRIFGPKGLMELVKALGKFLVVSVVAVVYLWSQADNFLNLGREPFLQAMTHAGWLYGMSFLAISSALLLIAAIDVPFQLWDHNQKLKMTLQEVRDEMKETEGRPEVKSKVRQLQQEMAQRRMMEDVPSADVIITNPTHYAVALKYRPGEMAAPLVVAMGRDRIALKIREIGAAHDVEIFEAPPLARALFAHGKIGEPIPAQLYYAVAQVLAFVFQMQRAREQGGEAPPRPDGFMDPFRQAGDEA